MEAALKKYCWQRQAKDLALIVVIVGVQDLETEVCGSRLADSGVIAALR